MVLEEDPIDDLDLLQCGHLIIELQPDVLADAVHHLLEFGLIPGRINVPVKQPQRLGYMAVLGADPIGKGTTDLVCSQMVEQGLRPAQKDFPVSVFGNRIAQGRQCRFSYLLQFLPDGIVDALIGILQQRNQRIQFGDAHCLLSFVVAK